MKTNLAEASLAKSLRLEAGDPYFKLILEEEDVADNLRVYQGNGEQPDDWDLVVAVAKRRLDLLRAALRLAEQVAPPFRLNPPLTNPTEKMDEEVARPQLNNYEEVRVAAYSAYLARLASSRNDVRAFRNDVLGGRLLTDLEAAAFVNSPALRYLTRAECNQMDIPFVGHTATVLLEPPAYSADRGYQISVTVGPPDRIYNAQRTHEPGTNPLRHIVYPKAKMGYIFIFEGSVVDELAALGSKLVTEFGWDNAAAVHFVLTGEPPQVSPIKASIQYSPHPAVMSRSYKKSLYREGGTLGAQGEITLRLAPWLSDRTVLQAFKYAQRSLLKRRNRQGDDKRSKHKNLRVFRFVEESRASEGMDTTWEELRIRWNAANPLEQYTDYEQFERDWGRARDAILFPSYGRLD